MFTYRSLKQTIEDAFVAGLAAGVPVIATDLAKGDAWDLSALEHVGIIVGAAFLGVITKAFTAARGGAGAGEEGS